MRLFSRWIKKVVITDQLQDSMMAAEYSLGRPYDNAWLVFCIDGTLVRQFLQS
jgi:hypothetical protein